MSSDMQTNPFLQTLSPLFLSISEPCKSLVEATVGSLGINIINIIIGVGLSSGGYLQARGNCEANQQYQIVVAVGTMWLFPQGQELNHVLKVVIPTVDMWEEPREERRSAFSVTRKV
ncbi:hypothetical protein B0H13DRAFT_1867830 [Mycena leptocephala]|nr:hypothetical protein B0H13DRAFT_1867830 [Mycena leptocephala]